MYICIYIHILYDVYIYIIDIWRRLFKYPGRMDTLWIEPFTWRFNRRDGGQSLPSNWGMGQFWGNHGGWGKDDGSMDVLQELLQDAMGFLMFLDPKLGFSDFFFPPESTLVDRACVMMW